MRKQRGDVANTVRFCAWVHNSRDSGPRSFSPSLLNAPCESSRFTMTPILTSLPFMVQKAAAATQATNDSVFGSVLVFARCS